MALIVQKYGGTSVGSPERIKNVAQRVAKYKAQGHQVVVVVSAMSGETNRLIALARAITPDPDPRELDVMVSTGEQVTIALLAIGYLAAGSGFPGALGFTRALLRFDTSIRTPWLLGTSLLLASALVAYIPMTHMAHFIAKYFTYHAVRWDDRPNLPGGKLDPAEALRNQ